ncbi:MAG TPA: 3-oxoacyl-[acyl-carrier-protein] synthase III C-terminal domain-containing protein [Acidimicrobiales bacterium]|nr:3-oxoacyl-[acyl-carrier-protein] synthase III C-terminal domain-containing protein [Acidimicrobiales bacterium]
MTGRAYVSGAASAAPPAVTQDRLWRTYFEPRLAGDRWAHRIFASAGVTRRHLAVDPSVEDVSGWSTGARMDRYLAEAVPLGKSAVAGALAGAGLAASDVGLLAVVSCTGYATPGVDIHLARDVGMAASTQRVLLGHMGCHAALPALGLLADYAAARDRPAVLLCVELSSLHVQPVTGDRSQLLVHALFSDAAAALVVEPTAGAGGLEVLGTAAVTEPAAADLMTWEVTDLGFRMGLSRRVPDVLGRHVQPLVDGLLAEHGVARDEVAGWAVHPGGPRVLDVVADRLALDPSALDASRQVLAEHGNCSSATVLLVLDELRTSRGLAAGDHVVALAFGPGLTVYVTLLRAT